MIYEFREWHQLTELLFLVIEFHKPTGSKCWTATAYLDSRNASSIPVYKTTFDDVRTAEQFAEMVRSTRNAAALELERWGALAGKNAGVREML